MRNNSGYRTPSQNHSNVNSNYYGYRTPSQNRSNAHVVGYVDQNVNPNLFDRNFSNEMPANEDWDQYNISSQNQYFESQHPLN